MRTLTTLLIMLTVTVPAVAQAQGQQGSQNARTAEARIDAALQAAARAKIPAALLESKVNEGRAKQVPPDRIATAVEARLEALVRASDVLARNEMSTSHAGELSIAADALQAGVEEKVLVRVMRASPKDQRVVATAVLTQLVQLGYESEPAFVRVTNALSGGAGALANLQAELSSALRIRGITPLDLDLSGSLTSAVGIGR